MKAQRKNRVRAFTLIEMMLVVAIIALILVIVGRGFEVARGGQKVANAISIIKTIRAGSAAWIGNGTDYTDVTMPELKKYGLLPSSLVGTNADKPGTGRDPWGGDISVGPGSDKTNVKVTLTDVPSGACNSLISKFKNESVSQDGKCTSGTSGPVSITFE